MEKRTMMNLSNFSSIPSGSFSDSDSADGDDDDRNANFMPSSFDFDRIRRASSSKRPEIAAFDAPRGRVSGVKRHSSMDHIDFAKACGERPVLSRESVLINKVGEIIKEQYEHLHRAVEGASAQLTHLESRSRHLENLMDDLKESVEYNYGKTDGKLKELENVLEEVHMDVDLLREKQDIAEAQLQLELAKLQLARSKRHSKTQKMNAEAVSTSQVSPSPPQQSHQSAPVPSSTQTVYSSIPPTFSLAAPPQQPLAPPLMPQQLPAQPPQNQTSSIPQAPPYNQPSRQIPESTNQRFHIPTSQMPNPPPLTPQGPHQSVPQYFRMLPMSQFSQPYPPLSATIPQSLPSSTHQLVQTPYMPSSQPVTQAHRPSEFYRGPPQYPNGHHSDISPSSSQIPSTSYVPVSRSNQPQLPTAKTLPYALPTASIVDREPGSSGGVSQVPIDEVIDRLTSMGFQQDVVRETVRNMTENGQGVDFNAVLDKLMSGGEGRPNKGWFGR